MFVEQETGLEEGDLDRSIQWSKEVRKSRLGEDLKSYKDILNSSWRPT
jgi:hypothetical protein